MRKIVSQIAVLMWLVVVALSHHSLLAQATAQPKIVLAGDSTVTDESGWGAGFKTFFDCTNLAKGGRSSRSFRTEGWWDKCLTAKPEYLLIQFGHNDQPGKGPERESKASTEFRQHLKAFVEEARQTGIKPVLVTSLERRRWNEQGRIVSTLADYVEATTAVAKELSVPLIELNRLSIELYNRLGETEVRRLEPMSAEGADHTHLNAEGSLVLGEIVARELIQLFPELADETLGELSDLSPTRADPASALGGLSVRETESTISIVRGNSPVLVYNKKSPPVPNGIDPVYARSGFLHPVHTPAGKTVTAAFPIDHAHQQGIFSAWVKTTYDGREVDFWNLAGRTGRVLHQRVVETFNHAAGSGFEVELIHQTASEPIVDVLRESWKVVAYPTDGTFFCFDIESHQRALTDKPLVIEKYHYGGMALRGRVEWVQGEKLADAAGQILGSEPSNFLNDLGSDRKIGNHERARWVSLFGEIDGKSVSITVLSQADNLRAPQAARLHPTKPYFCYTPCVDGQFAIDQQHSLLARYRYLITDAKPDVQWIEKQWKNWCGEQAIASVKGVATLDGKPLVGAKLAFYPELGGRPAYGTTNAQGAYVLKLDEKTEAAKVGSGIVLISTRVWDEIAGRWTEELVSKRYTTQGFPVEVRPGTNSLDFGLTTP